MNTGYLVEFTFINYFNNRLFGELNPIAQDLLKELYPFIQSKDKIIAYKYGRYAKVDVVLIVRGIKKGLSIKSGAKNSVHVEKIEKIIYFLLKNGYTKVEELKKYLYSDGTNDNTGKIRLTAEEYKTTHIQEIISINEELELIKEKLIMRFLIKTDINYKVMVDAFVYGFVNDFLWATKDEIVDYLSGKQIESTGVHVGSLFIQNWDKNIKHNPKYEYCRDYIQIKWYSLFDDLIWIMNERVKLQEKSCQNKKRNLKIIKFFKYILERM